MIPRRFMGDKLIEAMDVLLPGWKTTGLGEKLLQSWIKLPSANEFTTEDGQYFKENPRAKLLDKRCYHC